MPIHRSQAYSNDNTTTSFSSWFSPSSWLTHLNRNLDAWYNTTSQAYQTAKQYLSGESMVFSPEPYLPKEAKLSIEVAQAYRNRIRDIKQGIKEKQFSPDWITTLRSLFELVEQGKLSAMAYAEGLEKLENPNEVLPNELKSWIDHARTELGKLKQNSAWTIQQFRLSIYDGLLQVIGNKITPEEWLEQLDQFENLIPEALFEWVMSDVDTFYHRYCENVEQHATSLYEVPASVYQKLFVSIENEFAENQAENKKIQEVQEENENNVLPEEESNYSLMIPIKHLFNWIVHHPTETALFGLAATAFYKATRLSETDNHFAPMDVITNFAVVLGTQRIIYKKISASTIFFPALLSFIEPSFAQINSTFLTTFANGKAIGVTNTFDNGYATVALDSSSSSILVTKFSNNMTVLWAQQISSYSTPVAIKELNDTSLVVSGYATGYTSGYPSNPNFFLVKFLNNGSLVWKKIFAPDIDGSYVYALEEDSSGNLVVGGYIQRSSFSYATYTTNGGFLAYRSSTTAGSNDRIYSIKKTKDGGLILGGYQGNNGYARLYKVGGSGTWNKQFTTNTGLVESITAIVETTDSGIVATGCIQGSGHSSIFVTKFFGNGTFLWAKSLLINNYDYVEGIIETNDTGIVITGYTGSPNAYMFLTKFDFNGTHLWTKIFNSALKGNDIQESNDGGIVICGISTSSQALLIKFDANGDLSLNCSSSLTSVTSATIASFTYDNSAVQTYTATPYLQTWSVTTTSVNPVVNSPCVPLPKNQTVTPTPVSSTTSIPNTQPTPFPTPSSFSTTSPVTETLQSTQPANSSSSENKTIPLVLGLVAGGTVATGLGVSAYCFFKRKKSNKQRAKIQSAEMIGKNKTITSENNIEENSKVTTQSLPIRNYENVTSNSDPEKHHYAGTTTVMKGAKPYANIPPGTANEKQIQREYSNLPKTKPSKSQRYENVKEVTPEVSNQNNVSTYDDVNTVLAQKNPPPRERDDSNIPKSQYENSPKSNLNVSSRQYENVSATQKPVVRTYSNLPNSQYENASDVQKNKPKNAYDNVPNEEQNNTMVAEFN